MLDTDLFARVSQTPGSPTAATWFENVWQWLTSGTNWSMVVAITGGVYALMMFRTSNRAKAAEVMLKLEEEYRKHIEVLLWIENEATYRSRFAPLLEKVEGDPGADLSDQEFDLLRRLESALRHFYSAYFAKCLRTDLARTLRERLLRTPQLAPGVVATSAPPWQRSYSYASVVDRRSSLPVIDLRRSRDDVHEESGLGMTERAYGYYLRYLSRSDRTELRDYVERNWPTLHFWAECAGHPLPRRTWIRVKQIPRRLRAWWNPVRAGEIDAPRVDRSALRAESPVSKPSAN